MGEEEDHQGSGGESCEGGRVEEKTAVISSKEDLHFGWANVMALRAFFAGGHALWSGNRVSVVGNRLSASLSTFSILIWDRALW